MNENEINKDSMITSVDIKGKEYKVNLNKYSKFYSEKAFFDKIKNFAKKAGIKVIYLSLLLFYAFKKESTPAWAKGVILGALGYFILPIDIIPDVIPAVGYTDDLGLLLVAIGSIAFYIDDDIKLKAKAKLKDWFGEYNEDHLNNIDDKLKK